MNGSRDYIPSEHFVDLIEEHCPLARCRSNKHGYTCFVKYEDDRESFAVISEGQKEVYVYYDIRAASKRGTHLDDDEQDTNVDHVTRRVCDPNRSPVLADYLRNHYDRLESARETAPDPLLGRVGVSDNRGMIADIVIADGTPPSDPDVLEAFCTDVRARRQQLHGGDNPRHDKFGKMFGWRIEPLAIWVQPDIVLELLLLGAYEQVVSVIEAD